ncbi:MAG: hypothetical protein M3265_07995 [Actinomycetota bacterium]|nr:hypothetical protein [Actinomycetota bacterium]
MDVALTFARPLRLVRLSVLTSLTILAALAWTGVASAQDPLPNDDTALLDEYREEVPTGAGSAGTGNSGGGGGGGGGNESASVPLSDGVRTGLYQALGDEDARRLEFVATSPQLGAPASTTKKRSKSATADAPRPIAEPGAGAPSNPLSAAASAVVDDDGGNPFGLVLVLVAITAGLAGVAVFARRSGTPPSSTA